MRSRPPPLLDYSSRRDRLSSEHLVLRRHVTGSLPSPVAAHLECSILTCIFEEAINPTPESFLCLTWGPVPSNKAQSTTHLLELDLECDRSRPNKNTRPKRARLGGPRLLAYPPHFRFLTRGSWGEAPQVRTKRSRATPGVARSLLVYVVQTCLGTFPSESLLGGGGDGVGKRKPRADFHALPS